MKSILIISSEFPPQPGGIGHQAWNLANSLYENGYDVQVLTNSRGRAFRDIENKFDYNNYFKITRVPRYKFVLFTYFRRILLAYLILNKLSSPIVLTSGKFSLWIGGAFCKIFKNNQFIAILHGSEVNLKGIHGYFTKLSLKNYYSAISVSNFTERLAISISPKLNIHVIPNGYDPIRLNNFLQKKDIKGNPALITVGSISRRKGQHNVINAMPNILNHFPDVHYHVIGISDDSDSLINLIKKLNIENHVTLHGPLPDIEMIEILQNSKIFLMLSESQKNGDVEGFGIAILEANHFGIPCIGSNEGGIVDAIVEKSTGRLVNPHNTNEILIAISEILDNYATYSKNAKEWSGNNTWDKIITQYTRIIQNI